mmetsp:Transcript_72332/g.127499  ORF Transcript_72332/g.127499 Transcript_72332/m.127499 type:complete len:80 (-) Transcript_72332:74-313(-)
MMDLLRKIAVSYVAMLAHMSQKTSGEQHDGWTRQADRGEVQAEATAGAEMQGGAEAGGAAVDGVSDGGWHGISNHKRPS